MKDKVYMVQCHAGDYDDYRWWVGGIFNDPIDAENLKRDIEKEVDIALNTPQPINLEEDNISNKQWEIHDKWREANWSAQEFRGCHVVEYELNTRFGNED